MRDHHPAGLAGGAKALQPLSARLAVAQQPRLGLVAQNLREHLGVLRQGFKSALEGLYVFRRDGDVVGQVNGQGLGDGNA